MANNNAGDRPDDQELLYVSTDELSSHPANARANQGENEGVIRASLDISYGSDRQVVAEIDLGDAEFRYDPNRPITIRLIDPDVWSRAMETVANFSKNLIEAASNVTEAIEQFKVTVEQISVSAEFAISIEDAIDIFNREIEVHRQTTIICMSCRDRVGFVNDRGERLVCGIHPMGPESSSSCPDYRRIEIDLS